MPQRRSHFPIPAIKSSPATKRALSQEPPSSTTSTRQSKRLKSSPPTKTTPKKSPYFEHPTSEESESESSPEQDESGYEDNDNASAVSSPPSDIEDEDEDEQASASSADEKRKRKPKKKPGRKTTTISASSKNQPSELWRPGVKSHLPPGSAIYIPLPRARSPGKTPYAPSTLHPNTLAFLTDLRAHNDREWLKHNDADYRASQADWSSFVESLTEKFIEIDETVPELPPKDLVFRIYRDIRFSPDPTPYKTHFSAAWSRTGRKGPYAGYYVQVQPGGASFVGAGVWHPEAGPLALLRRAVDRRSESLVEVLAGEGMRREFWGGLKAGKEGEKKCVAKFVEMNQESALKTRPKVCISCVETCAFFAHACLIRIIDTILQGYEATHPQIALLRLRNYTIGKKLTDKEIVGPGALDRISGLIGVLEPFVSCSISSDILPTIANCDFARERNLRYVKPQLNDSRDGEVSIVFYLSRWKI